MANLMYAEMGLNMFTKVGGYLVSREQAKLARSQRKYEETMAALSAASNKNAINENQIAMEDQTVFARLSIQTAAMQEQADFDVEAAAAGVMGRSIRMGKQQLAADAARAETSLDRQAQAQRRQFGQQRTQVDAARIWGKDVSPLPTANLGATLFDLTTSTIDIWDAHNPKDRQSTEIMNRRGK